VFLEGQPHDEDVGIHHVCLALGHQLHHRIGNEISHAVIDAAAGEDDFRVITDLLSFVGKVIRIDADAVAAYQTGAERQEIPFGTGGFEHFQCIDIRRLKISASSLMRAMLISRCVFSITLAASATLILLALWVPTTTMRRYS